MQYYNIKRFNVGTYYQPVMLVVWLCGEKGGDDKGRMMNKISP
jgi:hypothetical protein